MWPISPPRPRLPRYGSPLRKMPPPTPVPTVIIRKSRAPLAAPVARLAERGEVAVVVDGDLSLGARHDERAHVDAGERQVRAELDGLPQEVDLAGNADADARDLRVVDARP